MKNPLKGHWLNTDDKTIRKIITDIRAPTGSGKAALKVLQGVKNVMCPTAITKMVRSVVVLILLHHNPKLVTLVKNPSYAANRPR